MTSKRNILIMCRRVIKCLSIMSIGFLSIPVNAHHSYSMYDGSIYKVFTGVIVRIVPNAAHFEMHFVPSPLTKIIGSAVIDSTWSNGIILLLTNCERWAANCHS